MSKKQVVQAIDVTAVIDGTLTDFKKFIDPFDQAEDQKTLIAIRQVIKKHPDVKWRRKKLVWIVDIIISLEFTTKSRGGRLLRNLNQEEN